MTTITTTFKSTGATGRITAKGGGKQRTVDFDPRQSANHNHGVAAGTLAKALGLTWHDNITHMGFNDGTHKFNI